MTQSWRETLSWELRGSVCGGKKPKSPHSASGTPLGNLMKEARELHTRDSPVLNNTIQSVQPLPSTVTSITHPGTYTQEGQAIAQGHQLAGAETEAWALSFCSCPCCIQHRVQKAGPDLSPTLFKGKPPREHHTAPGPVEMCWEDHKLRAQSTRSQKPRLATYIPRFLPSSVCQNVGSFFTFFISFAHHHHLPQYNWAAARGPPLLKLFVMSKISPAGPEFIHISNPPFVPFFPLLSSLLTLLFFSGFLPLSF